MHTVSTPWDVKVVKTDPGINDVDETSLTTSMEATATVPTVSLAQFTQASPLDLFTIKEDIQHCSITFGSTITYSDDIDGPLEFPLERTSTDATRLTINIDITSSQTRRGTFLFNMADATIADCDDLSY